MTRSPFLLEESVTRFTGNGDKRGQHNTLQGMYPGYSNDLDNCQSVDSNRSKQFLVRRGSEHISTCPTIPNITFRVFSRVDDKYKNFFRQYYYYSAFFRP